MSTTALVSALKRVAGGRRLRFLAVLVSAVALLFTAVPQVAQAADTMPGEGSGLRGTVSLSDAGPSFITIVAYSIADGIEDWTTDLSVQSGDFEMPDLAPGTYVLRFSSGGYRDQCYGGDACSPIEVIEGQSSILEPVVLQRMSPGTVKGRVVAGNGTPLAGVAITGTYTDSATDEHLEVNAQTDLTGAWVLADLPSGLSWSVDFSKAGLRTHHVWIYAEDGRTTDQGTVVLMASGRVFGTVRDTTGSGVAGAMVYLRPTSGEGSSLNVATGPDGSYDLTDVPPARYRLTVYATGHPQTFFPGVQYEQDASVLSVKEGEAVAADVTLNLGITLSGHLRDSEGNPISGTAVLSEKGTGATTQAWVATDGAYAFTNLWPGTFTVKASAAGHIDTWLGDAGGEDAATWRALASGDTSDGNDISLPAKPVHTVSGKVLDTAGNAASQLTVQLDGQYEALPTDADGNFSVVVDHAGAQDVAIYAGAGGVCGGDAPACPVASVTVPAVGDVEVALQVPLLGSLAGAITVPDGLTVDWGDVELVTAEGHTITDFTFEGTTDYLFAAVPQGVYSLEAHGDGFAPFRASVTIDGAVTKDIPISAGFTVTGTITVPQQEGWVEAVAVNPATGDQLASYWVEGPVSGPVNFTLAHLAPGSYVIGVEAKSGGWTWYPGGSDTRAATPVEVGSADVTGIDFSAAAIANLVHVTGSISLPDGGTIPSDNDLEVSYRNQATHKTYSMWTGALGAYHLDLPTGDYLVRVSRSDDFGTAPFTEQLKVTAPLAHDITLVAGGLLAGRLVDSDGLAIDGWIWATQAGVTVGEDDADGWGFWSFGSLPAGEVELHAKAPGFTDAALGTFVITPGQTTEVGVKVLTAAGRLPVRLPEVGDANINVVVTDLAGDTLTSEKAWPGELFWIDPVPAGKVLVRFEGRGITTEWWRDATTPAEASPVTIVAGAAASLIAPKLAAAVPAPGGTVSGTITNSTGRFGQRYVTVTGGGVTRTLPVQADGTWSVDIDPGTYRVKAGLCVGYWLGDSGCVGERITTWYPGVAYADAQTVVVTSGATTPGIDVDLGGTPSFTSAPDPTITGKAAPAEILTAVPGTWAPKPDHLVYQWLRDGAPITGATAGTYAVSGDDLGASISVAVTGTKAGFKDTTRTSEATATVLGAITPGSVDVSGGAAVDATLTAVTGTWVPGDVVLSYQWLRDGAAIDAATSSAYKVQAADAGRKVAVRITGSKAGFAAASATSGAVDVPWLQFTATPVPAISGTAKLGATLTAVPGTWGPGTVTLAYQWLRDGAEIGGATAATHVVVGADAGRALAVRVTGKAQGYASVSKTSAVTAKVPSGKMTTKIPAISGTLKVGRTLTAKVSGWKPGEATFTYTWYRSGKTIKGAIAGTYTLVAADLGKTIKVKATGTAVGYPSASATSKSTKKVAKGTIVAGRTAITGTPKTGELLTIATADWQPAGLKFSYQWYRSGKAISKAKAAGYTVTAADIGRKLTVKVTASLSGYSTASKTSKATAAVVA